MEADFRTILTSHAPLVALVPAAQIHADYYPQNAPAKGMRISKITRQIGTHMGGSDGLSSAIMQVDIRTLASGGKAPLIAIVNVLIGANGTGGLLHPFRGVKGSTRFQVVTLTNDRGVDFDKSDGVTEYLTASLDFDVRSSAA